MSTVIFGGTGTLGQELVRQLLEMHHEPRDILVFSRDEMKQADMHRLYPDVRYMLGDIRDSNSVGDAVEGANTVFHCAALKHVDIGERHPEQFIRTNVEGSANVATMSRMAGVEFCYLSSTDKAVLPINVYGHTKALAEALWTLPQDGARLNHQGGTTDYQVFRWGNVVGSRGSAVVSFIKACASGQRLQLTDRAMTRFWIPIEEAVSFMLQRSGCRRRVRFVPGRVNIPEMKGASVVNVAQAIGELLGKPQWAETCDLVGVRAGEKIHECLYSSHAACLRSDTAEQLTSSELKAMLEPVVRKVLP